MLARLGCGLSKSVSGDVLPVRRKAHQVEEPAFAYGLVALQEAVDKPRQLSLESQEVLSGNRTAGLLEGSTPSSIEVDEVRGEIRVGTSCRGVVGPPQALDPEARPCLSAPLVVEPPEALRLAMQIEAASELFRRTGGVHGTALARAGKMLAYCVDMGRHNAVDKLAGWRLLNAVDASDCAMVFSGRLPLEIMEKVAVIGCSVVIACGAPTNQSLDFAEERGITVVGFARSDRFNVYTHPSRVVGVRQLAAEASELDQRSRAVL